MPPTDGGRAARRSAGCGVRFRKDLAHPSALLRRCTADLAHLRRGDASRTVRYVARRKAVLDRAVRRKLSPAALRAARSLVRRTDLARRGLPKERRGNATDFARSDGLRPCALLRAVHPAAAPRHVAVEHAMHEGIRNRRLRAPDALTPARRKVILSKILANGARNNAADRTEAVGVERHNHTGSGLVTSAMACSISRSSW